MAPSVPSADRARDSAPAGSAVVGQTPDRPDPAGPDESRRAVMKPHPSLERLVPGVATLRSYRSAWLRPDLVAGVVLAAILVPQGMAYAELAGLPPVTGLYTTIACLIG